jgi:acyl-CoA synthetase (NDP forming)
MLIHRDMKEGSRRDLDRMFNPRKIALVGASNVPTKWGSFLLVNLLAGGFPSDDIYPVNPREKEIHGLTAYTSLDDVPQRPDLVVITTPAPTVPGLLRQCGRLGLRNVVVISSNFSEVGEEGAALERELTETAAAHDLLVVGPNTMGLLNARRRLYAVGSPLQLRPGDISFVSQSGNVGANMLGWGMNQNIGFSKFVGSGNEAVLHAEDFIRYFAEDDDTGIILAYLEGVRDGRSFLRSLKEATAKKPVIILKAGRTEEGGKAARSHTGSMAGSDTIYDAAFRQGGAVRADSSQDMLDLAKAFQRLPLPQGDRVGIITLGGGWGVLATDAVSLHGLTLGELDRRVEETCDRLLPPFWSHGNPVDMVGNLDIHTHLEIVEAMCRSPNFDSLIVLGSLGTGTMIGLNVLVSQNLIMHMSRDSLKSFVEELSERNRLFVDRTAELIQETGKPVLLVEMQFIGEDHLRDLEAGRLVILTAPEKAALILSRMLAYHRRLQARERG